MKKGLIVITALLVIMGIFLMGCEPQKDPNKKTIKIEITSDKNKGEKVAGKIRTDFPQAAGFNTKHFEIVVPGSVEVQAGKGASYEVFLMGWSPRSFKCRIYIDGEEIKPPRLAVKNREGSYSGMFEIKKDKEEAPKKK